MWQIDSDKLLDTLTAWKNRSVGYENWVLGRVIELIKHQPEVDLQNVIYCQQCAYFKGEQRWCDKDQIADIGKTCIFAEKSEKD